MEYQKMSKDQLAEELTAAKKRLEELSDIEELYKQSMAPRGDGEEGVRNRLKLINLVTTLTSRLMNSEAERIDNELLRTLQRVGRTINAERAYVVLFPVNSTVPGYSCEWRSEGVSSNKNKFSDTDKDSPYYPYFDTVKTGDTVYVPSVGGLPISAKQEKGRLMKEKIKTIAMVPLTYREEVVGCLGADFIRGERQLSNDELMILRILADYLAFTLKSVDIETGLNKSEKRYLSIFEYSSEGIYQSTPDGRFIVVNPAMAHILGYDSPEEMASKVTNISSQLYVHPEEREAFKKLLSEKGEVKNFRSLFKRKNGTSILVSNNARAVRDRSGKVLYYEGRLNEAQEKKDVVEKKLLHYELLMKNASQIFLIMDRNGKILEANRAALNTYGYDAKTIASLRIQDLQAPHTQESIQYHIAGAFGGGILFQTEHVTKTGLVFPVEISSHGAEIEGEKFLLSVVRTISKEQPADVAPVPVEKGEMPVPAGTVPDSLRFVPEPLCAIDGKGKVIVWNKAMERLTKIPAADAEGKEFRQYATAICGKERPMLAETVLNPHAGTEDTLSFRETEDGVFIAESPVAGATGREETMLLERASPVFDTDGNIAAVIETIRYQKAERPEEPVPKDGKNPLFAYLDTVPFGVVIVDDGLRISYANRQLANVLEYYDPDEIVGKPLEVLAGYDDRPELVEKITGTAIDKPAMFRQKLKCKDGSDIWCMTGVAAVTAVAGQNPGYLVSITSMADTIAAEDASKTGEMKYQQLLGTVPNPLMVFRIAKDKKDFLLVDINRAAEEEGGIAKDAVVGKSLLSLFPDMKESGFFDVLLKVWQTGNKEHFIVLTQDQDMTYKTKEYEIFRLAGDEVVSFAHVQAAQAGKDDGAPAVQGDTAGPGPYRALFEKIPVGIGIVSLTGKILEVNSVFEKITGYGAEELQKLSLQTFCCSSRDGIRIEEILKKGTPLQGHEVPLKRKNGDIYISSLEVIPVSGRTERAMAIMLTDTTEQKKSREVLELSERKYRKIFENAVVGIYQSSPQGKFVSVNPSMALMFGYGSAEDMIESVGNVETDWYADLQRARELKQLLTLSGVIEAYEAEVRKKDGSTIWVSQNVRLVRDESGNIVYFEGILEDITNRRRAEEVGSEGISIYRNIFMHSGSPSFLVKDDIVVECNRLAERFLGLRRDEIAGRNLLRILGLEGEKDKTAEAVFYEKVDNARNGQPQRFQWDYSGGGGTSRTVDTSLELVESGSEQNILVTFFDITGFIDKEQQLLSQVAESEKILEEARRAIKAIEKISEEREGMVAQQTKAIDEYKATLEGMEKRLFEQEQGSADVVDDLRKKITGFTENLAESSKRIDACNEVISGYKSTLDGVIEVVALIAESRDPFTVGHQRRVSSLATAIASEMGLAQEQQDSIRYAGAVHDVGKISVPSDVLCNLKRLSEMEYSGIIKAHAQASYEILKDIHFPFPLPEIVFQHHERIDGSGYPRGLKGDDIMKEARILAVADVVEAIASPRPYRPDFGIDIALEEIVKNKGALYDPEAVEACVKVFKEKGFKF